jgi:DNA invertase Pin-like site-specific DNA recombinase
MLIGYARVSTDTQDTALQLDALDRAGCERVYSETASGVRSDRSQLQAMLDYVRAGDVVVVWKVDRLGRDPAHMLHVMGQLTGRGVAIRSLTEAADTMSSDGRLLFGLHAVLGGHERDKISERTRAGLAAAKARGVRLGRPRALNADQVLAAKRLRRGGMSLGQIAKSLGTSKTTVARVVRSGGPSGSTLPGLVSEVS